MAEALASAAATPYLRITNVVKRFGGFTALAGVSLEIAAGEFVCFLGPSGCGKTTLLRAIAGLDIQSEGRIEQAGRDISALPPQLRDFGIVFQSYALFPNLTVTENIGYGLVSRRMTRAAIAKRVAELLALIGLPDSGAKYPAQLSGGQQQRVALARALAPSPGLLLLDEPLSALDARVRAHLRLEIKALHRRLGVTTVMVTHDQEEALTMADRIVVMRQGAIEQIGTPAEIYRSPATAFVADFVGHMNFLAGAVASPGWVRLAPAFDLHCNGHDALPAGTAVTLAIRPEDVVVRGVDGQTPNATEMRVARLEFLGAFCRAELALNGPTSPRLVADFSVNAVRDLGIDIGRMLKVALPAERIRLFPTVANAGE